MIKILIKLSFVIIFHVKIQHKGTNLLFCIIFVLIKLPRHEIPKNNYHLNETIFFVIGFYCLVSLVKKVLLQTLALNPGSETMVLESNIAGGANETLPCGFRLLICFAVHKVLHIKMEDAIDRIATIRAIKICIMFIISGKITKNSTNMMV